ncbi:MAG: adenylate/guanylate cyclase domain-containing protein [Bryobacteraceae bacterium]
MTIRRRVNLSLLIIAVVLGANLVIYFWNDWHRKDSERLLRNAIARQTLISSVSQELTNIQKQIALVSQVMADVEAGADPAEVARFKRQLQSLGGKIAEWRRLADPAMSGRVAEFAAAFEQLSSSWQIFYENFGVNHSKAILELAVTADPLSQKVVQQMLPALAEDDRQHTEATSGRFFSDAELNQRITIMLFAMSTLVGIAIAFHVLRYLVAGLRKLKEGASDIGELRLDHRISIKNRDEIGDLAHAFNEMADRLQKAQVELTDTNQELERRNEEVEARRQESERLLRNILPAQVADELQAKGLVEPRYFEDVSILFTDFVGFTLSTEKLAADDLVRALDDYFTAFDQIVMRYGLEKLKTIGDAYMCIGGLPTRNPAHPVDTVLAAFEMVRAVEERRVTYPAIQWSVRVGIHNGPVIAGVVGIQKFAFDIWGESVNYSSRMESGGAPNRINMSERTYSRVKDFFACEYRGKVLTKEKKALDMYFANGILPSLLVDTASTPPPAFLRRYRAYFQKDPPAFPDFMMEQYDALAASGLMDAGAGRE